MAAGSGTEEACRAYTDRREDIVDIDALVERPVHTATTQEPSATLVSLDGDHEARRERAGQERGGVEASKAGPRGSGPGFRQRRVPAPIAWTMYAHRSALARHFRI